MTEPTYDRLSFLDASFLALESSTAHMHVAGVALFEGGTLRRPDGGIDIARIRSFIESRLHHVPRYRQHLAWIPIEKYPVWVDDQHFNIDYHVRHIGLPKPGTETQLRELFGQILGSQLDRAKPLWQMWIVEGCEKDRFGLIFKIHHCMLDGISGVDLMGVLLGFTPTTELEPTPEYTPRPVPRGTQLLVDETLRRLARAAKIAVSVPRMLEQGRSIATEVGRKANAVAHSLTSGWLSAASRTPINEPIGPNRRFDWLTLPLDDFKQVKNLLGGTVNDVVLAVAAGAIRSFLINERAFDVTGVEFRAMVPVSIRPKDRRGTMGNQVAMWLIELPLEQRDPLQRFALIKEHTNKLKETNQALGASTIVQLSSGTPMTLMQRAARLATGMRPFNMTITNVPGPQFPMYLLDSKLIVQYPAVPLWAGHDIGIALFSYDGDIAWGFHADWDAVPDLDAFTDAVRRSAEELLEAALSQG
ncbi:putative diacylglycerol O-acyltransferase/MT1468 [bacterium BMS3Abin02]|nr:putative diacylglycerol O-acyltransferase/MT1468 [bacterium BMS3Abin02]GBE23014.1 putative diacylglycerol O-acyltransferase/MT1468 [bacterium BMS3Bbin01]